MQKKGVAIQKCREAYYEAAQPPVAAAATTEKETVSQQTKASTAKEVDEKKIKWNKTTKQNYK